MNLSIKLIDQLKQGAYGAHKAWVKDPNQPNRDPKAIFETSNR